MIEITKEKELKLWESTLKRYKEITSVLNKLDDALTYKGEESLGISPCSFCEFIDEINEDCGNGQCPFEKHFKCCEHRDSEFVEMRNKLFGLYDSVDHMCDTIEKIVVKLEKEVK